MFQRREQERPKTPALGTEAIEVIPSEEAREKRLCEVFRILFRVTAPPDIGVERKPIGAAEFLERRVRFRRVPLSRRDDDGPTCRVKITGEGLSLKSTHRRGEPLVPRFCDAGIFTDSCSR